MPISSDFFVRTEEFIREIWVGTSDSLAQIYLATGTDTRMKESIISDYVLRGYIITFNLYTQCASAIALCNWNELTVLYIWHTTRIKIETFNTPAMEQDERFKSCYGK